MWPLASEDAAFTFNPRELQLINAAIATVQASSPQDARTLTGLVQQLADTRKLVESCRPLREPTALGHEARNADTLIKHLITLDGLSGDLSLPLKATLSRTYLVSKIMFLRAFLKATKATTDGAGVASAEPSASTTRLCFDLREELAESIYTLLAEELLLALLRKPSTLPRIKLRAAQQLIAVWDDATLEVRDFAPMLESAWHARNRVQAAYGTLLGTSEAVQLACADCDPHVIEFFSRREMSTDEASAFEEFLFNMTSEELTVLRRAMTSQNVCAISPAWAAGVLGRQIEELEHSHEIDPMALYRSYQRRQLAADFRIMSGTPGPRRTAEAYLIVDRLEAAPGDARLAI